MSGIYIHIPFCKQACSYCDFYFSTTFSNYREQLINSLCLELRSRTDYMKYQLIETIYFGGGTPSLLTGNELNKVLNEIYTNYNVAEILEITLEANPDDINREQLNTWKESSVNRLSIGVQSFINEDLTWMNRSHKAQEAIAAISMAKANDFSLTIDLMYGLPNTTIDQWRDNIQKAIKLNPEHISAYCLTVEKKTALHKWVKNNAIKIATEEEQAEQFMVLVDSLEKGGYEQYEISNFARNENYSKHNANYWKGVHYLGVGPSAHSFNGHARRWNISNNQQYIKLLNQSGQYFEEEELSLENQFNEYILTGLRTKWGVNLIKLATIHPLKPYFNNKIIHFKQNGLVEEKEKNIVLTNKGKLIADQLAVDLFMD